MQNMETIKRLYPLMMERNDTFQRGRLLCWGRPWLSHDISKKHEDSEVAIMATLSANGLENEYEDHERKRGKNSFGIFLNAAQREPVVVT